MTAQLLRHYITLVESYQQPVQEADISRRGLFKGAAALASVAALPPQVRTQAVDIITDIITDKGPELMNAAVEANRLGVTREDIYFVNHMLHRPGEDKGVLSGPLSLFPKDKIYEALSHMTGISLNKITNDKNAEDAAWVRLETIGREMARMPANKRFELLLKTWKSVGLGDEPGWYNFYQMTKRYPELFNTENPSEIWDLLRDFLPDSREWRWAPAQQSGIDVLRGSLDKAREWLSRWPDDEGLENQVKRLEKLVRGHEATKKISGGPRTATASSTSATPTTSPPKAQPTIARPQMSPVLRAVVTILNAFKRMDRISSPALKALENIKPEDVKLVMQRDAGTAPAEPKQEPAALPAPEPKIDIGLDSQPSPVPVSKPKDRSADS